MKILKEERGNILVLTALSMTMLISFMAIGVDVSNLYFTQHKLQTLADAAAMAGALEASACSTTNCDVIRTAATTAMTENGSTASDTQFQNCASAAPSVTGLLLIVNNGPCALGSIASDPNYGDKNYVEAVVARQVPTYFAKIFGKSTVTISARAEAGKAGSASPCLNTNDLTLNSGTKITDALGATCGINDNASSGLSTNDKVTVDVGSFTYHGTSYNKNCNSNSCSDYKPLPTTGSAIVADPFKDEITAGTITTPTMPSSNGTSTTSNGVTKYTAGNWPSGITFSGTNTLAAGTYYIGSNVIIDSGASISGTGVTLYMASGGINSNSTATINLTAPSSGSTAGMLIWEADGNSATVNLNAGTNSSLGGAIYLPSGQLTLNGDSTVTSYGMIYANSVMLNSAITLGCSSMPGGVCPGSSGSGSGSTTIALAE
jgi:Flp pilus assembly protein TadG